MHICYMDDSGEDNVRAFSILTVPVDQWKTCFNGIKQYRKNLRASDGIFMKRNFTQRSSSQGVGTGRTGMFRCNAKWESTLIRCRALLNFPAFACLAALGASDTKNVFL